MTDKEPTLSSLLECVALLPELIQRLDRIEKRFESEKTRPARKFLTLKQAAEELNLCVKSVRRLIERGLLQASKGTRAVRIPFEEIENYKRRTV